MKRAAHRPAAHRPGILLAVHLVLAGCGASGPSDEPVVRDSAGVRIVENPAPDDRVAFVLEPDLAVSIGTLDGAAEYAFQGVRDAVRLSDGRIVVADGSELKFYDPAGRHLRTSGGEGEGPGEFTFLTGVVPCGEALLAGDMRQQRLTVFDMDGEFVRTDALPASGNMVFSISLVACDHGSGLPLFRSPPPMDPSNPDAVNHPATPILRVDAAAGRTDTVVRVPTRPSPQGMAPPFQPTTRYAFSRSGIHTLDTETIEVRTFGADGALRRIVRVPHSPVAVSDDDIRRAIDARVEQLPEAFAEAAREQMERAPSHSHMPAVGTMAVDAADRLWIQPFTAPGEDAATTWLVLGSDGLVLGTVEIPPRFRPLDIGEDWVLGVAHDELDVPYVRVYGFRASPAPRP